MIIDDKLELGIISSLIADESLILEFYSSINPNFFGNSRSKILINAILEIKEKSLIPDYDALENHLEVKKFKIDVYDYCEPLNKYNFSEYLNRLKELTFKRELAILTATLLAKTKEENPDVFELNQNLNNETLRLTNILTTDEIEDNTSLIRKVINEIEQAKINKGITGCLTGFTEIDAITGGYQKSDLIILAARPAMGKTSLAIGEALNAAIDYDKNILFFSLEMGATQLMKRQLSLLTDIPLQDFNNDKEVDFNLINNAATPIIEKGFKLFDKCFKLYDIKAQCRRENNIKKLDAIYIDYLQLIKHTVDKGRSKENEVGEISRELKLLAKELEVPIICLCQLSRAVESRGGNKIPQLSDLRDSGSIEQDADIVQFIYRPEYYGILEDENGESTSGKAMVIFAKNRSGRTGAVTLKFIPELTKFQSINNFEMPISDEF